MELYLSYEEIVLNTKTLNEETIKKIVDNGFKYNFHIYKTGKLIHFEGTKENRYNFLFCLTAMFDEIKIM